MRITTTQASRMTGIPASAIPQLMLAGLLPWGAALRQNKKTTCYIEEARVRAWLDAKDLKMEEQKNV